MASRSRALPFSLLKETNVQNNCLLLTRRPSRRPFKRRRKLPAHRMKSNTAAINKMEANFVKLIDQGQQAIKIISEGFDGKINDIKCRLDKGEGRGSISDPSINNSIAELDRKVSALRDIERAGSGQNSGQKDMIGWIFAAAAIAVAVSDDLPWAHLMFQWKISLQLALSPE